MADSTEKREPRRLGWMWSVIAVLGMLLLALALIRVAAAQRLESRLQALRDRGLPATTSELDAFYLAVDDPEENAAQGILATIGAIEMLSAWTDSQESRGRDLFWDRSAVEQPLTAEELAQIAELVSAIRPEIAELIEVAGRSKSRYPADLSLGYATLLTHLSKVREACQILRYEAIVAAHEGEAERAVKALEGIFDAAHSMRDEPLLISGLVRIACDSIGLQALQEVVLLLDLKPEQNKRLGAKLDRARACKPIALGLVGEAACIPEAMDDLAGLSGGFGASPTPMAFLFYVYKGVGAADFDAAYVLDRLSGWYEVANELDPTRRVAAYKAKGIDDSIPKYFVGARMLLPALSGSLKKEDSWRAGLVTAAQALDPEEQRVDPATGGPLVLTLIENRQYTCSYGADGIDNGIGDPAIETYRTDDRYFFLPVRDWRGKPTIGDVNEAAE